MKTKNMRKKALLSSVAMLLVAVVALGGATYAWFTTSVGVTATGVNLTTDAKSNLQILAYGSGTLPANNAAWANTIALTSGETDTQALLPVSSADGETWYGITTEAPSGSADPAHTDFLVNSVAEDTSGKATYDFWVRDQKGNCALYLSAITPPSGREDTIWPALRCAIYVGTGTGTATKRLVYNPCGSVDSNKPYVISGLGEGGYTATGENRLTVNDLYTNPTNCTAKNVTIVAPTYGAKTTALVSTMSANQAYHVQLIFWLEGNSSDNTAIGQTLAGVQVALTTTQPT